MFWWGRYNAIAAIVLFGGSALLLSAGQVSLTVGLWMLMIVLRVALLVCNALYTAFTGKPLFYDVRIDDRDDDAQG